MRINDLPDGIIVWYGDLIVGVKGLTLENIMKKEIEYATVTPVKGINALDFKLNAWSISDRLKAELDQKLARLDEEE